MVERRNVERDLRLPGNFQSARANQLLGDVERAGVEQQPEKRIALTQFWPIEMVATMALGSRAMY